MSSYKQLIIGGIPTSEKEIFDLGKAWIAIAVAFANVMTASYVLGVLLESFLIAFITVGTAFLLHELAHKLVAQHYRCVAEFRAFDQFLILGVLMSFLGVVFMAPGAVMIAGRITKRINGIISVAGPATNIVLALLFFGLGAMTNSAFLDQVAQYGTFVNAFLALFNMIPFWNFDGKKIWQWNKAIYLSVILIAGVELLIFTI